MKLTALTSLFALLCSAVKAVPVPDPNPQLGGLFPGVISALPLVSGGTGGGGAGD